MKKYIEYLKYLLRHKYFVMVECFKEGLYWRGFMHDASKFLPSEFFPYVNHFEGDIVKESVSSDGYYKPVDTGDRDYDFAWLTHQKKNRHHWQWWVLPNDDGGLTTIEIQEPYLTEMICDWLGAAKAQGRISPSEDKYFMVRKWYAAHKNKMQLHEKTRSKIQEIIKWKS